MKSWEIYIKLAYYGINHFEGDCHFGVDRLPSTHPYQGADFRHVWFYFQTQQLQTRHCLPVKYSNADVAR